MDAEPRAPVVDPEPEAPRAAEVLGIPTDGTPEQIAAAALRIVEQHGLPPPTKRASVEESKCEESDDEEESPVREATRRWHGFSRRRRDALLPLFEAQRLMMWCCRRSSPRTSWTSASRPGPASRSWGRRRQGEEDRGVGRAILHDVNDAPERVGGRAPPPPRRN